MIFTVYKKNITLSTKANKLFDFYSFFAVKKSFYANNEATFKKSSSVKKHRKTPIYCAENIAATRYGGKKRVTAIFVIVL